MNITAVFSNLLKLLIIIFVSQADPCPSTEKVCVVDKQSVQQRGGQQSIWCVHYWPVSSPGLAQVARWTTRHHGWLLDFPLFTRSGIPDCWLSSVCVWRTFSYERRRRRFIVDYEVHCVGSSPICSTLSQQWLLLLRPFNGLFPGQPRRKLAPGR